LRPPVEPLDQGGCYVLLESRDRIGLGHTARYGCRSLGRHRFLAVE
jgi:hypothetical protein